MATLTAEQIEQKKQQLKKLDAEAKKLRDELVAAGAIELSDEQLNEINGGFFWDKVKEQAKKAAKETTDTGNLSLY
jgi:bacteriocin-like protein